jgi:hypothetical protein
VAPAIRAALQGDGRYDAVEVRQWDWDQTYSSEDYRQLLLSDSRRQMMDEPSREALLDDIEAFVDSDFGGRVTRPLVATLTTAELRRP